MRKIVLTLLVILSFICIEDVYATECNSWQIEEGNEVLKDLTYYLEYDPEFTTINGDPTPGYFKIFFTNLPEGYYVNVGTTFGDFDIKNSSDYVYSPGGIVKFRVYSNTCDTPIKSMEAKVPFYKQYCDVDVDCNQNLWFDGTYENTVNVKEEEKGSKINLILLIVLIVLLIIIAIIGLLIFRKRRYNEQDF